MSVNPMAMFSEAQRIVQHQARFLGTEQVPFTETLGRVLAEDIPSDMNMPPFNKSAMDGFACRKVDLDHALTVIETISAGRIPKKKIGSNQCSRIMTGSVVPEGANCVIPVEHTVVVDEHVIRFTDTLRKDNICRKGEDITAGDIVLHEGQIILPQHIAILSAVGSISPRVALRPVVGVISTGTELVEPEYTPGPSQIRNSNGYQLCAQVTQMGAIPRYFGIAKDTKKAVNAVIKQAMEESDLVLLSGGVSMGDFDFVPEVLEENGFKLLFKKIALKPGQPTVFGYAEKCFCFGLPGNPVATFIVFELLVKSFLFNLMGHEYRPLSIPMRLAKTIVRKGTDRDSWIVVSRTAANDVEKVEYHGSGHLQCLASIVGMICMPCGMSKIEEGTMVSVRQI